VNKNTNYVDAQEDHRVRSQLKHVKNAKHINYCVKGANQEAEFQHTTKSSVLVPVVCVGHNIDRVRNFTLKQITKLVHKLSAHLRSPIAICNTKGFEY